MAAAAQRAAANLTTNFTASANAAKLNTLAMRETLVVARELSRGNFTRLPGSLTLLGQGISSGGGLSSYAQALGLIKKVQDAELAEAAANANAAAAAVQSAAQRAQANIAAADTELALAEAQARLTEGTSAAAAAQIRLAEAHAGVAAAAGEAAIAEEALAAAAGRASEASAAAAGTTRTVLGSTGAVLIGVGIAATGAALGFEAIKTSVSDSGVLRDYANSLGLSAKQMDELKQKTDDFSLTFGDVWNGIKKAASDALEQSSAWQSFKQGNASAFGAALQYAINFAAGADGAIKGAYDTIIEQWRNFPAAFGDVFYQAVNKAIDALNSLVQHGTSLLNGFIGLVDKIPGVSVGTVSAPKIGNVANPFAGSANKVASSLAANVAKETATAKAAIEKEVDTVYGDIIDAAEDRIKKLGGNPPKPKKPKKEPRNPADDELAKLDAQIAGENRLADAYLVSDAAAIKAEATEKALTLAVEKHATAAQKAALVSKELALSIATISAQGAKHVADLNFEADTRQKVNDMIAAGIIPATQANAQLQLETELRPLNAALTLAEGDAKQRLLKIIYDLVQAQGDLNTQTSRTQALQAIAANDNDIAKLQLENSLMGSSNAERAVAIAQLEAIQQLASMPGLSEADRAAFIQSNVNKALAGVQTPFQQWAKDIPQTAAAITEALHGIETRGFDSLASAIADVVTGTKSLKEAFSDVAQSIISEIIQMTVKMLIFRSLSSVFPGLFGGSGGGGSSFQSPFANGAAFLGGNVIPFATGGVVGGPTLFPMAGGQTGLMGEAGLEAVMPLTRDSRGRLGVKAENNNTPGPIEVHLVIDSSPELDAKIVRVSSAAVAQAAPVIVKVARQNVVRDLKRQRL